jgi:hypothetical protein
MRIKLDKRWTDQLLTWPESGMGYQRVDVTMVDGRELTDAAVLNAELLEVPAEFAEASIADLRLHHEAQPSRR